jgi:hypothetical protein
MDYVPLDAFRYASADTVTGPAIIVPHRARGETLLVTGGNDPMLCFLDGSHEGQGFEVSKASRFGGLAFEEIEFRVDWSSKFQYALVDIPLGALIVHDAGVDVVISVQTGQGFNDARRYPLEGAGVSSDRSEDVGFSKWKAFQRHGDELREVYAFEASKTGDV